MAAGWVIVFLGADPSCGQLPPAVALLTGFVRASARDISALRRTTALLAQNVLEPLDADVVAMLETDSCAGAHVSSPGCTVEGLEAQLERNLVAAFGHRLRALGLVEAAGPRATTRAPTTERGPDGLLRAWIAPAARTSHSARTFDRRGKGAIAQWHKLREAWRLMETLEGTMGARAADAHGDVRAGLARSSARQYGLVIKLRPDLAPTNPMLVCALRDGLLPGSPPLVHAMTDWLFWGRRDAMRVAAAVWDGLPYFETRRDGAALPGEEALGAPRDKALRRPVAVRVLLRSLLSLPAAAFERWLAYHKIESLPVPDMGKFRETYFVPAKHVSNLLEVRAAMEANLAAALAAGWEWIDPEAAASRPGQPALRFLISAESGRPPRGIFITEQDFIFWLVAHNVTACDMGAGVRGFLSKKGRRVARPTVDDCLNPPPIPWAGTPDAGERGAAALAMPLGSANARRLAASVHAVGLAGSNLRADGAASAVRPGTSGGRITRQEEGRRSQTS
ncbi:hypothetical protein KFE25_011043 [Diacronema lutheri]|uniref:Uncharacterized protein n=2 Tax=Diacronema lutheri TaxID=2081491 RepID=A0A8J5XFV5_DIALT|nr:hypothetical protein KFE25_011043 [Diacronema lutheri]